MFRIQIKKWAKGVSSMKFYAFRLMIRPSPDFNILHRFRKLMKQFVVDMYVKVETERLVYQIMSKGTAC